MERYRLYSRLSDRETILELWGASTKHPDSIFFFSRFLLSEYYEPEDQTFPWLLECASKLNFPFHSYELGQWACEMFEQWHDSKAKMSKN